MSTTSNKRSFIVGIFIFIGLVIFLAAVFTLGGKQKAFVKSIHIKAIFNDVSGLKTGNNVWFSGVKIGTIKKLSFYGSSQVEVTMSIEETSQKYIRKDAKAKIGSEGMIGNKLIVIYGGNSESPEVQEGDQLQAENATSTEEMMATLQENNKNLVDVTADFKVLTERLVKGQGTMGALLNDSLLANQIRSMISNLRIASANTNSITVALARFTNKLNNKQGLANQLLTDTMVYNRLKASVNQLQQTTTSAAQLTSNLNKASNQVNNTNTPVGALLNDQEMAQQLKQTMQNLETSTKKLDENMEALQHNFLLRGFFKKKAKQQDKQ